MGSVFDGGLWFRETLRFEIGWSNNWKEFRFLEIEKLTE